MLKKGEIKKRKRKRTRKRISGREERPRLSVARSLKHIKAQIINDDLGKTLVSASSLDKEIKEQSIHPKRENAKRVGELLSKRAKEKGIKAVVFDKGPFSFSGRIKALAQACREEGLEF
ncbi:MAG: 50S ribosomal protein L18 [bacterium]